MCGLFRYFRFGNASLFLFKRLICLLVFCLSITVLEGQNGKEIHHRFLVNEYDNIIHQLKVTHPALYRFIGVAALDSLIAQQRSLIDRPLDQLSFYKVLSPVFHAVKDGHTKLLLPIKSHEKILGQKGMFPYDVWISDDQRMYITGGSLDDVVAPEGSEITAIEGMSIPDFIATASPYVAYENDAFRYGRIADNISWLITLTFDFQDVLTIEMSDEIHQVEMIPYKKWKRKTKKTFRKDQKRLEKLENNEYKNLGNQIGYLKIHQFGSYDINKYIDHMEEIFAQINREEVATLIIDLRDNAGGDPRYVEAFIHNISDIPFCRTEMMYQLKKGRPNSYYRMLRSGEEGLVQRAPNHMIFFGDEEAHREPITFENEFSGEIYVLVNGQSYSAAAAMAAVMKCYDLGTIVGSETGGTRIFQAHNRYRQFPRSKLYVGISTTMIFTSCSGFEDENGYREGIMPDILVEPTLQDILSDKDIHLETVMKLISREDEGTEDR